MKVLNCVALTIAIIGAINWGLIGFFDFNLVSGIFGDATAFTRVIRTLHDQSVRKSLCRRLKRKCCLNRYVSRQQFFMPYFSLRVLQILYRSLHFRNLRTGLHG